MEDITVSVYFKNDCKLVGIRDRTFRSLEQWIMFADTNPPLKLNGMLGHEAGPYFYKINIEDGLLREKLIVLLTHDNENIREYALLMSDMI